MSSKPSVTAAMIPIPATADALVGHGFPAAAEAAAVAHLDPQAVVGAVYAQADAAVLLTGLAVQHGIGYRLARGKHQVPRGHPVEPLLGRCFPHDGTCYPCAFRRSG